MVRKIQKNDGEYYECQECKLRYADEAWAEKCEVWCKEHHTCNLEIIEDAIDSEVVQ